MPRLSLAKLERHLYQAADILRRAGMDAATYKGAPCRLRARVSEPWVCAAPGSRDETRCDSGFRFRR